MTHKCLDKIIGQASKSESDVNSTECGGYVFELLLHEVLKKDLIIK